jgi:hypothetical protein
MNYFLIPMTFDNLQQPSRALQRLQLQAFSLGFGSMAALEVFIFEIWDVN